MTSSRKPHTRPRLLVVDSDVHWRVDAGLILAAEGFDVCLAENGEQAISQYCRRPLALVITELAFGGKEGFEIIEELQRELVCTRFIGTARAGSPTAGLTACTGKQAGRLAVLIKTCSPAQLLSAVREALGESEPVPTPSSPTPSGPVAGPRRSSAQMTRANHTATTIAIDSRLFHHWRERWKGVCLTCG